MSAVAQKSDSETQANAWILSTSSDLAYFKVGNQEILKIFSQPVANRMQGMCRFEKGFEALMPLLRGLTLMGRPSSLSFIYDIDQSQAFFTFSQSEAGKVQHFFNQIIGLLKKEVKFKEILKKVIENNNRFRSEQALLNAALHGKAWD
jgi:hypothetical protein